MNMLNVHKTHTDSIPSSGARGLFFRGSGKVFPDRMVKCKIISDRHFAILPDSVWRQLFPLKTSKNNLKICAILKSAKVVLNFKIMLESVTINP